MASARMGLRTALFSFNLDLIAQMSCNPAIGGIAKGHLVREVDALGGIMGEVADAVGIQFRLLNTSRGPAVWSPRAQCDKRQYRVKMRQVLESQAESPHQAGGGGGSGSRAKGSPNGPRHRACATAGRVGAGAVVITTGTFLNGLIHCGEEHYPAGRSGEPPSVSVGRGTQEARACADAGSRPEPRRGWMGAASIGAGSRSSLGMPIRRRSASARAELPQKQISCHIAYTTPETLRIIRENVSRSPMYSGQITGDRAALLPVD